MRFQFNADRTEFALPDDPDIRGKVAENHHKNDGTGSRQLLIGTDFGLVTDIQTGPNGNLYVISISPYRTIYEIYRRDGAPAGPAGPAAMVAALTGFATAAPARPPLSTTPADTTRTEAVAPPTLDTRGVRPSAATTGEATPGVASGRPKPTAAALADDVGVDLFRPDQTAL
jgi:hypothetical protein